ncbi:hypothetical protein ACCO45_007210 [Purpureocillium lilacinum]|uniref:Uncharacterized protein n=1 Tax=Purpureocillium lilacinum TaxID=33203 RepID=A0ACC4DUS3_PURLI
MAASMIGEQVFAWQKRGDKGQFQTLPRAGQTISGLLAACASRGPTTIKYPDLTCSPGSLARVSLDTPTCDCESIFCDTEALCGRTMRVVDPWSDCPSPEME